MTLSETPVRFRMELHVNDHVVDVGGFALPGDEEFRPALATYLRTMAAYVEDGHGPLVPTLLPGNGDHDL